MISQTQHILGPIMFADDTDLFYSHHDIKTLFSTVSEELEKLGAWFTSNRSSLNIKKTKYTLFHKNSVKDNIPLNLPDLHISNKSIERKSSIKFLGVMLDEHIAWNDHIHVIEKSLLKMSAYFTERDILLIRNHLRLYISHIYLYIYLYISPN